MTTDDFLDSLRDDWRRPAVDLDRIRRRTERRRRFDAVYRPLGLAGCIGTILFGIWFGWIAIMQQDAVAAVGAIAFLVSAPLLLIEYRETLRDSRIRYDESARGVLLQAAHQLARTRRMLRGCRWSATILGVAALIVLAIAVVGPSADPGALPIAATWGGVAILVWSWQAWRARGFEREAEHGNRLLAELEASDDENGL